MLISSHPNSEINCIFFPDQIQILTFVQKGDEGLSQMALKGNPAPQTLVHKCFSSL